MLEKGNKEKIMNSSSSSGGGGSGGHRPNSLEEVFSCVFFFIVTSRFFAFSLDDIESVRGLLLLKAQVHITLHCKSRLRTV